MASADTIYTSCKVCRQGQWQLIDTLLSGVWDKSLCALQRQELSFPIGECQACHHVQVMIPYTESIFKALYFSSGLEPDMWCETPQGELSPYDEMLNFFKSSTKNKAHIVDFGAGAGTTLQNIEKLNIGNTLKLSSVDFHDYIKSDTINFIEADLNQLEKIQALFDKAPISLAISTHLLEHIVDPVNFLKQISNCLADDGAVFIEVPDCSSNAFIYNLAYTNLVHGQHIHYYTKDSLSIIAEAAGLEVTNIQQLTTGNIPRLQVLLKKASDTKSDLSPQIDSSATLAVTQRFTQYKGCLHTLYTEVFKELDSGNTVNLWGIGGDFYQLVNNYPSIYQAINEQKIRLYDYELAGHTFAEQTIFSSSELEQLAEKIFITPIYSPTRERMKTIAKQWSSKIIDCYEPIEPKKRAIKSVGKY